MACVVALLAACAGPTLTPSSLQPNVTSTPVTNVPGLVARGLLAPVAPFMASSRILKQEAFDSQAIDPFIIERQLQCVPLNASGLVVYYNKALFQNAGVPEPNGHWSRQAFLDTARALTRDNNSDGRPDQYGLGVEPSLTNLTPFIWQSRGQVVDNAAWPTGLALSSPAVVSATDWLVSLQNQYHVAPDAQAELAEASEQRFEAGSLAMMIGTRASVPALRQVAALDWEVAPLPANNTGVSNVVLADGLCLTAASANKTAAWQFIEFAASPAGQTALARSGAIVPALRAVAHSPEFLDSASRPAHNQVYLEALAHAAALPRLENWSDIQAIADEELQQAFYGQKSVVQAMADATTRSEEYFKIHVFH